MVRLRFATATQSRHLLRLPSHFIRDYHNFTLRHLVSHSAECSLVLRRKNEVLTKNVAYIGVLTWTNEKIKNKIILPQRKSTNEKLERNCHYTIRNRLTILKIQKECDNSIDNIMALILTNSERNIIRPLPR
ncbi:hypothetical protein SNEBB_009417 [Seison nebaliae]|nr:hypothetical protein SNEBB_009417 [Seison nebaliae]